MGMSSVPSLDFLHNKDIFCYLNSLLDNAGCFQLTSATSIVILLVILVATKHGHHIVSCSNWQTWGGCSSYPWCNTSDCTTSATFFFADELTITKHDQFLAHTGNIEGDVFFLISGTALQAVPCFQYLLASNNPSNGTLLIIYHL